jgi:hypothetical protein
VHVRVNHAVPFPCEADWLADDRVGALSPPAPCAPLYGSMHEMILTDVSSPSLAPCLKGVAEQVER